MKLRFINMNARDLIEGEAELDDEENEESFDEEAGEVRPRANGVNGHLDDSSEEEEDDDDEDAARAVRPTLGLSVTVNATN